MEVQSRQILNNEHAMLRARELGADWLLHVDSDELLCLPAPAPDFFSDLESRGCTMYTFVNVEGVPEAADSADVLRSVRYFRENFGNVPRNPAAGVGVFEWQLRLGGYFISYENGKSAVNVKHAVKCLSVCMWEFEPPLDPGSKRKADGSTCTWWTNNHHLWEAAAKKRAEGKLDESEEVPRYDKRREPMLLHFCVCEFATFWRKRWTQLGYLSASDQFRVRASSGAMMARFYRLQREDRQSEARQLYEAMCTCQSKDMIAQQVSGKVLIKKDPKQPCGRNGPSWPRSRRPVCYAELAADAEARGAHFDAWVLHGKAIEEMDDVETSVRAQMHCRRASCSIAAGIPGCALSDAMSAAKLGEEDGHLQFARARAALGHTAEALEVVEARTVGTAKEKGVGRRTLEARESLKTFGEQLRNSSARSTTSEPLSLAGKLIPTVNELQEYVTKAVRPDAKNSRLWRAVLAVAMGWWQELGGDEKKLANALGRAAITARMELAALDGSVRPRPLVPVRTLWDANYEDLQRWGALAGDFEETPGLWPSLAKACHQLLGEKESVTVKLCDDEKAPLFYAFRLFSGLAAEAQRAFHLAEMEVCTEIRVSRSKPCDGRPALEIDNGGLLPDNRREASFRTFIPLDGGARPREPGTLNLALKDGEVRPFELRVGRLFFWWSRQTFHQVMDAEAYFTVACWAVIPMKGDKPGAGV
eukprot:gnl/TRDRNA2_/TRDRNA2_173113_c2_seq1.p1 gnl/TRDRNA2_/TRDRNA2_173113_c2~~gnl/TRDRNA2_/TRDRNA2_173113_c2_seq1.p1  ORF type:complete len:811 (+),score=160.98 gnl/TRDRNA2_/TRDRNA2_173113_c2_seq1:326-2434(+)